MTPQELFQECETLTHQGRMRLMVELEMTLAASTDERLRMLALGALIAQSTQSSGWCDEAIARLENYRNDPSPLVAEAAQFTFVS